MNHHAQLILLIAFAALPLFAIAGMVAQFMGWDR
jgi:hypothetical protein